MTRAAWLLLPAAAQAVWREYSVDLDKGLLLSAPGYDPDDPVNPDTYAMPPGHSPYRAKQEHITQEMIHTTYSLGDPESEEGSTKVHISYPSKTGRYPWLELHHAFIGVTPEGFYNELKREIVSLGYIVFYTEPFKSHDPNVVNDYDKWMEAHEYYMNEGPEVVYNSSIRYGKIVELDPYRGGILCHADGCDITKEFAIRNPQVANLFYFIDPVMDGYQNSKTEVQLQDNQIVLVGRTDYCTKCCMDADYDMEVYNSFSGQNIKTYARFAEVGQCSLLNWYWAENCRASNICNAPANGRTDALQFHKRVTATIIAAGTQANFENREDMQKYYTDPAEIPETFYVDGSLECDGCE